MTTLMSVEGVQATNPSVAVPLPGVIGLIAGEGNFPILLAQGALSAGIKLVVFGVNGLASDKLQALTQNYYSLKLTELSRLFELCHQHQVRHITMAGRVPHLMLLKQISFDTRVLKLLGRLRDKKADSLLRAATEEIESEGITVLKSTMFLESCMPRPGLMTLRVPITPEVQRDIEFGYPIAKEIARLDIGQSIAVKNQIVVAVEGVEGTDDMIRRAGELAGPGMVVIKVSKPRQDMRFDVPVAGIRTIELLAEMKAAALCVTAGESLFFDRQEAIALAERSSICILAHRESGYETPVE